jgi:hypothetical protein
VNEEEIIFNKLHDIYKNSLLNYRIATIYEYSEPIDVSKENVGEIDELT